MAGDWIKLSHTLPDKPEVVAMSRVLGIDQDAVTGKLIRFWVWSDQHSVDGNALGVTESFLDRITMCEGFAAAMVSVGWLTVRDGTISVPNFDRHNGQTAKARALTKNRVTKNRNALSVTKSLPEKRREEKSKPPLIPPKGGTPSAGISKENLGISRETLCSVDKLRVWLRKHAGRYKLRNNHATLLNAIGAAERALEIGDDPVGLFVALIRDGAAGDWSKISCEQMDRAKIRIRDATPDGVV